MSHVFISYSKQNKEYARKLADHLLSQGFDVWIDDQIEPSDEWFKRIVKGIRECAAFLIIMSPESGASRWVEREVMLADELQKPMFPVLLSGDLHTCELWALFIGKQYEDARGDKLPGDRFYAKLALNVPRKAATSYPDALPVHGEVERQKSDAFDGWIPKLDDSIPDVNLEQTVADFTKRHLERLREMREKQVLKPPDLSHILPPPFEWCEIPAGKVTIEYSDTDHKTFEVLPFLMAKYPITNGQYQVFVDAEDGYRDSEWWGFSDDAKLWRRENKHAQKTGFDGDDLPRTNVSWYEALAYCQWLSSRLKLRIPTIGETLGQSSAVPKNLITLPSEQQWQRAAQGDDGRMYPWGNDFHLSYCNISESKIQHPTPITDHPHGTSPYEVRDMAGNVWEWCLSSWHENNSIKVATDDRMATYRVVRGGSFHYAVTRTRTRYRFFRNPQKGYGDQGFRIVFRDG